MDSLRLEKCYRSWKADLTTEYTPLMASLDRFVKLDKPGGFIGQSRRCGARRPAGRASASCRCSSKRPTPMPRRSRSSTMASDVGRTRDVGRLRLSARQSIALAYVRTDLAVPGKALEVEILGERRRAVVGAEPLYDPENVRLRA